MPPTADHHRVRAILETDRVWSAFALADLAPQHQAFTEWHVQNDALLLIYRGFTPPLLFAMDNAGPLLDEIAGQCEFYISVRQPLIAPLEAAGYQLHDRKTMHRLVLAHPAAPPKPHGAAESLGPQDYDQLVRLFADGETTGERPAFFHQLSLATGVYYGVRKAGELVAAAGTLVSADEQSVACIGNVYTRRDHRGQGLASCVTSAIIGALLMRGIQTIVLNVRTDNHAAIRVYENLGFQKYCDYQEARAVAAQTLVCKSA
jgi:ribosomal protein S18 acetylase RimI-like enzyme